MFLAVRIRFWLCFFSALRIQACWFLFAKSSCFVYWLRVELFFNPFTVLCEKAEHLSRSDCTRKSTVASWLAENLTFLICSVLCARKRNTLFLFRSPKTGVLVPVCKKKCVCLLTESWTFFQSVHCSVRESRTFVTIGKHAQKHVHFLCSVRERGTRVKLATPAQKRVSWIAKCLTFFNLFSALCEKAEHVSRLPELNFFQSVHCSVRESRTFVALVPHA